MDLNVYNFLSKTVVRIIVAIVIFLFGLIFGGFFSKLAKKIIHELEIDKIFRKEANLNLHIEQAIAYIVKYVVYFIALNFALQALGVTTTILYIIFIAIAVIFLLLALLSFKDYLPNLIAGIIINRKKLIRKGVYISIMGISGKIMYITSTDVRVRGKNNEIIVIPNSMFLKNDFKIIQGNE